MFLGYEEGVLPPIEDEEELPRPKFPVPAVPRDLLRPPAAVAPGIPSEVSKADEASRRYADVYRQRPEAPKPKWWQRALAGVAGAAAGVSNAGGRTRPIDIAGMSKAILAPGYDRKLDDWARNVEAAGVERDAANSTRDAWWKNRQLQSTEDLHQAQMDRYRADAEKDRAMAETAATKKSRVQLGNTLWEEGADGKWSKVADGSDGAQLKTLEQIAASVVSDPQLSPEQKQAKLKEIGDAYSAMHPDKPVIHWATGKDGTVTAVTTTPSEVTKSGGAKDFGKIGKPEQNNNNAVQLTPEAVDFWARFAGTTGQLPSLGMGNAGASARGQVLNRAPQVVDGDVASNKASNQANSQSLAAMQKMRDAVVAFESTALANLDLFTKQAKPIVDSGSPLANRPLRSINRNALGNADLAAFDAARQVALTEISKVVNNPNLTGQLSDSARHEVSALIPENATLNQIYRVVGVLKQDMANRKKYLDQGISEIKGRMGGRGGNKPSTPQQQQSDPLGIR